MRDSTRAAVASAFKERIDRAAAAETKASIDASDREAFRAKAVDLFENTIRPAIREIMELIPASVAKATAFEQDVNKAKAPEMSIGFELDLMEPGSGSVKPRLTFKAYHLESRFAVLWHYENGGAWRNVEKRSLLAVEVTASSVEDDAVQFLASVAR
jgi:hypothetical protein